jgi:transcriptional regulator with XRE-family HTH domain
MPESFGKFAQRLRKRNGLGLRQAAKLMGVSPAYLSQVERDIDAPKTRLMAAMSIHYNSHLTEIEEAARRARVEYRKPPQVPGRTIEEVVALYRLGGGVFSSAEVEDVIRHLLEKRGDGPEDIERVMSMLRDELPRLNDGERESLFAANVKPRFLTKRAIAASAYALLNKHNLGQENYEAPTPIERLVEDEGIAYAIDELPAGDGGPVVLGRTRWNGSEREITISAKLAESERECDWHRLRFTLGHELFHALEHLPLMSGLRSGGMERTAIFEIGFPQDNSRRKRSRAERAVERWAGSGAHRGLLTREDWREWQANAFASSVLMPEWAVRSEFEERTQAQAVCVPPGKNPRELALELAGEILFAGTEYLQSLAQLFDVSRQAMAIRLLDLGLVVEVES